MEPVIFMLPLLIVAGLFLLVAGLAFRQKDAPGVGYFFLAMLAAAVYAFFYAFEVTSQELFQARLFYSLQYLGNPYIATFFLLFALQFVLDNRFPRVNRYLPFIVLIPISIMIFAMTHEFHPFFVVKPVLRNYGGFHAYGFEPGIVYKMAAIYHFICTLLAVIALSIRWRGISKTLRPQILLIIIGSLFPFAALFSYILGIFPQGLDPVPFALLPTAFFMLIGLRRYHLLDITPLARERLFEDMAVGAVVLDVRCRITDYNRSAASFLGLTREDIGQPASNALPFWQRLGNGKLADLSPLTVPAAASYGERCQLQMTSAMLQDAKGIRRGWMLVFYDVTEHADLVDSLVAARQEADAANKAKSDFVANMSHEIRTPLQGVIGFNELLAATSLDEQQRSFLQMAAQSAAQLLSVLNDVLDFSRIEAGKMSFDPEATDISKLVEEAVNGFVPAAARKGIALNLQSELQSAEKIHVDPMRLLQVLNNLIGNAVKFTDEGHVTVTLRLLEPMVEIRIADTGVGISSQEQARLFNPFVQADGSMARKYGGTGLGLVISKRLLEQMDGAITLSSEPDKGTVCTVRIPLAKAEAEPGAKFQQNKLSPGQFSAERHVLPEFSGTIIVADDVPDNLALLDYMLKMILPNATIELRGDGQSVLTSLAAMTADLVLLDVQMPVMGGLEVARAIKASPVWCKIPVIALSAATHQQARDACVDAGMDDFLSKPVSMQALSRLLARYLCAKGPVTI